MLAQDPFRLDLVGAKSSCHETAPEIVGMLLKYLGVARKQVIGCDHETHVACRGYTVNLSSKIAVPGQQDIVPAVFEALFKDRKHRGSFRCKKGIAGRGIFGKQDFHHFFFWFFEEMTLSDR
jgi:hypothetical protein